MGPLGTTPKSKPTIEIIPNTKFIVFHGDEHHAQPVKLSGVVRFHAPEAMSIKNPKIWLEGKRRISWFYVGGMAAGEISDKRSFFDKHEDLGYAGTHKINRGTIEWPFEFELQPDMVESVEGMASTWVVYSLNASVARPGWNQKDIATSVHVRLVRTLGIDQMETTRSRTNADIWANKLSYSISIPTDAVVFGTSITADVELCPIRKGIRLGKVEMRLIEAVTKRIQASESGDPRGDRVKAEEVEVAKREMDFPEESRRMVDDDNPDNPTMEDERYVFQATLPLPKSLKECRQDVDCFNINITHRFKLMVNIHNPEGHVSQLVCRLPVRLFISPNLPVDEQNIVQSTSSRGMTDSQLNYNETAPNAPPEYGRHQLDALYHDISAAGYMSTTVSGANTPFFAQSRRASSENLAGLGAIAEASTDGISSAQLQSRLARLQDLGSNRTSRIFPNHSPSGGTTPHNGLDLEHPHRATPPHSAVGSYFGAAFSSSNQSPAHSMPQSRRGSSDPVALHDIHSQDFDLNTLSRVPSYGVAVRGSGLVTPFSEGPPSYIDATSRPPSPGVSVLPQRPGAAHVRHSGTSTPTSNSSGNTLTGSGFLGATAGFTPLMATNGGRTPVHRGSMSADDEARLKFMRAKAA